MSDYQKILSKNLDQVVTIQEDHFNEARGALVGIYDCGFDDAEFLVKNWVIVDLMRKWGVKRSDLNSYIESWDKKKGEDL